MNDGQLKHLGQSIRNHRKAQRITMAVLAEKCEISTESLSKIERGRTNPSFCTLYSLVRELGISADALFYPDMSKADIRKKALLLHYDLCSEENQAIIAKMVEYMSAGSERRKGFFHNGCKGFD